MSFVVEPSTITMDVDARTKETAATLLGVAFKVPEASDSSEQKRGWEAMNETAFGGTGTASETGAAATRTPATRSFPPASEVASLHSQQHQQRATHAFSTHPQHVYSPPATAPLPHPPQPAADAVLSMTSIGFGIDSSVSASWGDATEAAIRALQDAMERSTLRLPMSMPGHHLLQIKVQLGVPPKQTGSVDPMIVDLSRLTSTLSRSIPVLPIRVVVGGLFLKGEAQGSPSICTAVACITLQSQAPLTMPEPPAARVLDTVTTSASHASPWASLEAHPSRPSTNASLGDPAADTTRTVTSIFSTTSGPQPEPSTCLGRSVIAKMASLQAVAAASSTKPKVHRSTSIEMLAMISAELAGDKPRIGRPAFASNEGGATTVLGRKLSSDLAAELLAEKGAFPGETAEEEQLRNGNYNYKKLPPGVTTKNNRRLFVKHTYRDHSGDAPLPEEQDLAGSSNTSPARTPNAAFPLKLHETLTQIENNGHGDIIGWLPHGRSFKIHKQKEFAEIILPKYFVMTKKSSFLRQLNLYGFNRFSAGLDQGSYYHEKFLRGLKFLCRRMTRQKVNGNRIRSAGNPDEEPNLARFPSCPPPMISTGSPNKIFSYNSREEENDEEYETDNDDDDQDAEDEETEDEKCSTEATTQRNNGGVLVSFPLKLQRMLDKLEAERDTDIISWLSHGRAFIVHDPESFVDHLMPVYFNQSKYSSFQRQLHMYNFQRITAGRDKSAYHNPNFQRGKPHMCARMTRTRVNGKGCRKPGNPNNEPNFYSLESLPPIAPGTTIEVPSGNPDDDDDDDDDSI